MGFNKELIDTNGFIGNKVYQTNPTLKKIEITCYLVKTNVDFYKAFSLDTQDLPAELYY